MSSVSINIPKANDIAQIPQGRLGMWILIAGELVIFGGLIAAYLLYRFRFPEWGEQAAHTSTPLGALNTFILLTSSFTVVLAHNAALRKKIGTMAIWMSTTILLGGCFLIVKTIEYTTEISHGFTLTSPTLLEKGNNVGSLFWTFYYLMTGLHALHVVVGMTVMLVVTLRAIKGKDMHRIEIAGLYWHMVDIIWVFLFPLLYIAK